MVIRDRGSKKWVSIFPTELVELLREWQNEDNTTKRPELDEWDMDMIQEQIEIARTRKCDVKITTWREGQLNEYIGVIQEVNLTTRLMYLEEGPSIIKVQLDEVVGAIILE